MYLQPLLCPVISKGTRNAAKQETHMNIVHLCNEDFCRVLLQLLTMKCTVFSTTNRVDAGEGWRGAMQGWLPL